MVLSFCTVIQPGDGLYAWLYMALTLSPSWLLSGPRLITAMYPLYPMLAVISRRKSAYLVAMILSIILTCVFSYLYAISGTVV